MIRRAARRQRVLSVVSQYRYDPLVWEIRNWVRDGLLGSPLIATVTLQCQRPPEYYSESYWRGTWGGEGGSVLVNQGYHVLDILRWTCGEFEVAAAAMRTNALTGTIETEDTLAALLEGRSGILATLGLTAASAGTWKSRIEIVGQDGSIAFDLDHPARLHCCRGGSELRRRSAAARSEIDRATLPGVDRYAISHRGQIADFCRSVNTGAPMLSTAGGALKTLELIGGIYARAGRPSGRRLRATS